MLVYTSVKKFVLTIIVVFPKTRLEHSWLLAGSKHSCAANPGQQGGSDMQYVHHKYCSLYIILIPCVSPSDNVGMSSAMVRESRSMM